VLADNTNPLLFSALNPDLMAEDDDVDEANGIGMSRRHRGHAMFPFQEPKVCRILS
jgi:hypothetical protein